MAMGFWTPERDDALARLIGEGLSASGIAAGIGDGCNRSQVIGRAWRRGLRIGSAHASTRGIAAGSVAQRPTPMAREPEAPQAAVAESSRPSRPVTILELEHRHCRWPLWKRDSDPRLYCGDPIAHPTVSFCRAHAAIAFVPAPPRRGSAPAPASARLVLIAAE